MPILQTRLEDYIKNMISHETLLTSQDTRLFGARLARYCGSKPMLIALRGDLGSGKTTCAQGFLSCFLGEQAFASPTYNYLNIYEAQVPIFHFDLYRIENPHELSDLGLLEHLYDVSALRLVEWPERAPGLEHYADIAVHFERKDNVHEAHISYFKS